MGLILGYAHNSLGIQPMIPHREWRYPQNPRGASNNLLQRYKHSRSFLFHQPLLLLPIQALSVVLSINAVIIWETVRNANPQARPHPVSQTPRECFNTPPHPQAILMLKFEDH